MWIKAHYEDLKLMDSYPLLCGTKKKILDKNSENLDNTSQLSHFLVVKAQTVSAP